MVKNRWYALILLVSLIAGMIHGLGIENSLNVFVSWLAVGLWTCFTLVFLTRVKYAREFRSPHNTSFFVFGPLFIGILYSLWDRSTGLLFGNLLGSPTVFLSPWTLVFGFPYLMYGIFIIYACFRRYTVVYVGQKSFSARKVGFFLSFLTTISGFYFALVFLGLMFWLLGIISLLFLIVFGIFGGRPAVPDISTIIRRETPRISSSSTVITTGGTSPTTKRRNSTTTTTTTTTKSARTRSTPTTTKKKRSATRTTTTAVTSPKKKTKRKTKPRMSVNFEKLKPKAGILSLEDFKCIFCFQDFKPEDKRRGVVLCPHCRYPAHADEFNDWLKSSNLCSRCDTTIPAGFRRKPKVIPVKDYIEIIKEFKKKKRK